MIDFWTACIGVYIAAGAFLFGYMKGYPDGIQHAIKKAEEAHGITEKGGAA